MTQRKYVSVWQKRKAARYKNRCDLENGVVNKATESMRLHGITGRPYGWKKKQGSSIKDRMNKTVDCMIEKIKHAG